LSTTGALLAAPFAAVAQQRGKVVRLGFVTSGTISASNFVAGFRDELRKLGWIEGQNIVIEYRYAMGDPKRLPEFVEEFLRLKVDLIVTTSTPGALAAKSATSETPIVFSMVSDPVASGIVTSLARPGGNLTGWSNMLPETSQKLLELLKEIIPKASRFAVVFDPTNPGKLLEIKVLQADARRAGFTLQSLEVRDINNINAAFQSMAHERPDGLVILQDTVTFSNRKEIVELATTARIPATYQVSEFVDLGGLMSYGLNLTGQFRRSAVYVDKILRGAKPGDLAVEQPTMFELVINLKAAKALGVAIPHSILLRADRLIE
jgi:putative tryptophan/tyrosine transport system substrate-binding protein